MNIGIDLDDVLAQFAAGFILFHNNKYGTSFHIDEITEYDTWNIMGITKEEFHSRIHEFYGSDAFDFLEPEDQAPESICNLSDKHTFFIVTSRPDSVQDKTEQWIRRNVPEIENILHSNQFTLDLKASVTKLSLCKEHNISILVEDAPKYIDEVAAGGVRTILFDKPWNRGYSMPADTERVHSWKEISCIIERIEAQ